MNGKGGVIPLNGKEFFSTGKECQALLHSCQASSGRLLT